MVGDYQTKEKRDPVTYTKEKKTDTEGKKEIEREESFTEE